MGSVHKQHLFKQYILGVVLFLLSASNCWAGNEVTLEIAHSSVLIDIIRDHAGSIICTLLILLAIILWLLGRSQTLQQKLIDKNHVLIQASRTITSYFDVVDKNILSVSLDISGNLTYISSCFIQRYDKNKKDLIGHSFMSLFEREDEVQLASLALAIDNHNGWSGELLIACENKHDQWVEVNLDTVMDEPDDTIVKGYTIIFNDIANQKMIRYLSETDSLTSVHNRYRINQLLQQEIQRKKRYQHPIVVGMIDLDSFKPINDTYGHMVGDDVLVGLVEVVKNNIRKVDILGRWGGEEFIIIFPETTLEQAFYKCEKLRECIMAHTFVVEDISMTASFGITEIHEEDTLETIVNRADKAMYQAKAAGKNCVKIVE